MQRLRRLRLRKIKAACFPYATEQAQRQPPETGHRTARPNPSTALHGTAAAAVAVMFCCLCVIGTAAAQPGQCPAAWTTAALSVARTSLKATSLPEQGLAIFAGGDTFTPSLSGSKAVDIFNATSGRWTTAALSVARLYLAATSLPEQGLAIFAGGYVGSFGL